MTPAAPRFPFPSFPRGWYVVAFSPDLPANTVRTVHYFDQDIVLFRTASGVVSAVDKTCPHLGAHVGGGRVEGECLRCPFHRWGFDATGACIDVPYASKVPPKAALRSWPLREQNGLIFVHYCPSGQPPAWELPLLDEQGWTPNQTIRWELRSHPQEIAENTVDCAHLAPVHSVERAEIVSLEQQDHVMRVVLRFVASGAVIQTPDEINDVELDVTLHGIGQLVSNTHVVTAGLRTRQRIHPTPIDRERVAIFAAANTLEMPDAEYTREIDQIFWSAFVIDFAKDFPIWENKSYLERPTLASGDGPIGKYRRWVRQFYLAADATDEAHPAAEPVAVPAAAGRNASDAPRALRPLGALGAWLRRASGAPSAAQLEDDASVEASPSVPPRRPPSAADGGAAAPASQFPSVDAYFEQLEARFDASAAGDLVAVYQWLLTGSAPRKHYAQIEAGRIRSIPGTHSAPTVTIEMSSEDYLLMINGQLNGALAFSTGRGKLRGPVRLAMKMKSLFPLEKRVELSAGPSS